MVLVKPSSARPASALVRLAWLAMASMSSDLFISMFLWAVIKSDTEFKELIIVDFIEINEDLYTIGLC